MIYKPTNNNLRTYLNSKTKNVDTTPRHKHDNQTGQFGNQRTVTIAGARETVGSQEKMLLCKQAEKGVPLQAEQADWLEDTDEEIDEQELEAHYSYMATIQDVPTADSGTDSEPLEKVQYDAEYNVFANERQHSEQPESINNTCVVEKVDSNVILDSPDMCDNDIQNDQNAKEYDDERDVLANLIANLTLDTEENKKILNQDCASLTEKLSNQTENVSKEVYNGILQSFAKVEKYSISFELALQQCKEQIKNDKISKVTTSTVFLKECEQYHEIEDLKAQLQDKNIVIIELKKLNEKYKGKYVKTKFDKPFVVRQPNALRIPKPSVLGKLTIFSDSLERKSFSKTKSVTKTNVPEGLLKSATTQNLHQTASQAVRNTNVIKPGMETDIQEKDKNRSQNDKTEHENEKTVRSQSQSQPRDEALERASKTEPVPT
ncbi:hypothetical protein Tco_0464557 [Tanacetum coccineum]